MQEEYTNVITLTDSDGSDVDFEVLDIIPYNDHEYAVLLPVDDESDSPEAVRYVISSCDMVLLMSVNPGAGGPKFIPETVQKIRQLRAIAKDMGASPDIEIDGGINPDTGRLCVDAGASVLVAGSSVFGAADPMDMVRRLHDIGR